MALSKYLKLDPKRLPHPSGPLSTVVPTSSIAAANKEVKAIVKEENEKERGPYEEQIDDIRLGTWPTVTSPRTMHYYPKSILQITFAGKFFPYSCIPYGIVAVVSTYHRLYLKTHSTRANDKTYKLRLWV